MKTELFHYSHFTLKKAEESKTLTERMEFRTVARTDSWNYRFALIDNKAIQDPRNWDTAWFGQYE